MALIEMDFAGSGSILKELPRLTLLGGGRVQNKQSYTFAEEYDNICVITYSDSNNFTSISYPIGSRHTEIGVVPQSSVNYAPKELRVFDIHNVASGTTVETTWNGWANIVVFSY